MSRGNGGWGALKAALGGQDRKTLRRWLFIWMALVALGWFYLIPKFVSAQDKKDEAKPTAAPEAAKPAEQAPAMRNDPNGGKTGDVTILGEKSDLELDTALVKSNCVTNVFSGSDNLGNFQSRSPWHIQRADRVHCVEEAQEMDLNPAPLVVMGVSGHGLVATEARLEQSHVRSLIDACLVVLVYFVGKRDHLLVAHGQQSNAVDHSCQEACCEGAAREAKDVDAVSRPIVAH